MASGLLENVTIYAEDTGNVSQDANRWYAYAIHIDNDVLSGNKFSIRNCNLRSDRNSCLGIGLRKDGKLSIENNDCFFPT